MKDASNIRPNFGFRFKWILSKSLQPNIAETFFGYSLHSKRLAKNPLFEVIYHFTARWTHKIIGFNIDL
jgi:hypothetical protein